MRVEESVEVFDEEQGRWVAGEVETDGPDYVTVKSAEEVGENGLPSIYVLNADMLDTHLRRHV